MNNIATLILEGKSRVQRAPTYAISFDPKTKCFAIWHNGDVASELSHEQSRQLISYVVDTVNGNG